MSLKTLHRAQSTHLAQEKGEATQDRELLDLLEGETLRPQFQVSTSPHM